MQAEVEGHCRTVVAALQELSYPDVARAAEMLLACHERGGTVFIAGNGGSAATASHFACDLTKGTRREGVPRFRVMPLTDNVPLMTAWANDENYDCIFAQQLAALVRPGDVALLISGSGSSPNILEAAKAARQAKAVTIALTGRTGGKVAELSDLTIRVPADTLEPVEDGHSIICHALTLALRAALAG